MAANFQLVMHTGPNQGKVAPLEKDELFIGRDLSNDIVINDAEVSRRHARLVLQAGGYVLEDLGSTNGTSVNGQRLMGPYTLRIGDVITLGEHVGLGFEPSEFDPDATVVSAAARPVIAPIPPVPSMPSQPPQPPKPPAFVESYPTPQPPPVPRSTFRPDPQPAFVGQVPAEPVIEVPARKPGRTLLIVGLVVLGIVVLCGVALAVIDTLNIWCTLFPFLAGCP
jgi:predicted component of type VI protein secretion system